MEAQEEYDNIKIVFDYISKNNWIYLTEYFWIYQIYIYIYISTEIFGNISKYLRIFFCLSIWICELWFFLYNIEIQSKLWTFWEFWKLPSWHYSQYFSMIINDLCWQYLEFRTATGFLKYYAKRKREEWTVSSWRGPQWKTLVLHLYCAKSLNPATHLSTALLEYIHITRKVLTKRHLQVKWRHCCGYVMCIIIIILFSLFDLFCMRFEYCVHFFRVRTAFWSIFFMRNFLQSCKVLLLLLSHNTMSVIWQIVWHLARNIY